MAGFSPLLGAFGGIMAGVGHISILGIGDWASKLKGKSISIGMYNDAGKYLTDHIRFSNTAITWLNSLSSTINWYTQKGLVWPAAIAMGLGMVLGVQIAVWGTGGKLGVALYKGLFGLCTWAVSIYMFYQITPRAKATKSKGREAAKRFQQRVEELRKSGRLHELEGITNVKYSLSKVECTSLRQSIAIGWAGILIDSYIGSRTRSTCRWMCCSHRSAFWRSTSERDTLPQDSLESISRHKHEPTFLGDLWMKSGGWRLS